ncbi:hypothetical protein FACS189435_2760 [Bacteroidia bacterium]|nr:hypothetical protein FACS189435_2760 [Bacteroidia bacterium]
MQIGAGRKKVVVKDIPSLSITLPASKITLQLGQTTYSLKVQVKNLSATQAGNIAVTADGKQEQTIAQLSGGESGTVQFNFPSPKETTVRTLTLSAKPPGTPPVTATARVSIEVPPPPTF